KLLGAFGSLPPSAWAFAGAAALFGLCCNFLFLPWLNARFALLNSWGHAGLQMPDAGRFFDALKGFRMKPVVQNLIYCGLVLLVVLVFVALFALSMVVFGLTATLNPLLGILFLAVSMLVLFAFYFAALLILSAAMALAPLVGVNEKLWGFAGLWRAWKLIQPRFWAYLGGILLISLIEMAVGMALSPINLVLSALPMAGATLSAALTLFAQPLYYAFYAQLYFDERAAREGIPPSAQE
ncbi:MAG: hypothetical protein LBU47_07815, partial [Christensenellaceae bacterium]|nr:hypothetical protein [Christensenellaceae bacterium]